MVGVGSFDLVVLWANEGKFDSYWRLISLCSFVL